LPTPRASLSSSDRSVSFQLKRKIFTFSCTIRQVVLPDLASLRIAVCEESGKLIGHRVLPVKGIRPGYRHVSLRNESGQYLTLPSLFVHVQVKDYVPDRFSDFAEALANPIRYQSELEKRTKQLEVLTMDEDGEEEEEMEEDQEMEDISQPPQPQTNIRVSSGTGRRGH